MESKKGLRTRAALFAGTGLAVAGLLAAGATPAMAANLAKAKPAAKAKPNPASVVATIKKDWIEFFSGTSSAALKESLVQDPAAFAATIKAQAGSPEAKATSVTVSSVHLVSATEAVVIYSIKLGKTTALANQRGLAVKVGGAWKVSVGSFCTLLDLQGGAPPICKPKTPVKGAKAKAATKTSTKTKK